MGFGFIHSAYVWGRGEEIGRFFSGVGGQRTSVQSGQLMEHPGLTGYCYLASRGSSKSRRQPGTAADLMLGYLRSMLAYKHSTNPGGIGATHCPSPVALLRSGICVAIQLELIQGSSRVDMSKKKVVKKDGEWKSEKKVQKESADSCYIPRSSVRIELSP